MQLDKKAKLVFVIVSILSLAQFTRAEEHAAAAPAEHGGGEAAAAEGGNGAPAEGGGGDLRSRQKLKEWIDVETKLSSLKAKIESQSAIVNGLIAEKNHAHDKNAAADVATHLSKAHKELQTMITEYEEQRNLLKFRYPEKGLTKERVYERIEVKSLEEMETQLSTEGKFKKVMNKVRSQFPMESSKNDQQEASQGKVDPKKIQKKQVKELPVQKNNLTEPIVLSK